MSDWQKFQIWFCLKTVFYVFLTVLVFVYIYHLIGPTWALIIFCVILALNLLIIIIVCFHSAKTRYKERKEH